MTDKLDVTQAEAVEFLKRCAERGSGTAIADMAADLTAFRAQAILAAIPDTAALVAEVERLNAGWQKANADNLALGLQLTATRAAGDALRMAIRDSGVKRTPGLYEAVMAFDAVWGNLTND